MSMSQNAVLIVHGHRFASAQFPASGGTARGASRRQCRRAGAPRKALTHEAAPFARRFAERSRTGTRTLASVADYNGALCWCPRQSGGQGSMDITVAQAADCRRAWTLTDLLGR